MMLPYTLKKIWNPALYQGHHKTKHYFEGWYYKIVDKDEENVFAIIPGISMNRKKNTSHAFIQVINGKDCTSDYITFNRDQFHYVKDRFEITIENNFFSRDKLVLDLENKVKIRGKLTFHHLTPWPVTLLSPGIMGWYAFVPFMECYHGVISLNHLIKGTLEINNRSIVFDDGLGYMEKDWGKSFPSGWIWFQSNHFEETHVSLTASVARIPWLGRSFTGFIIGLFYKGGLYPFSTYTGAKIKEISMSKDGGKIRVIDKNYELIMVVNTAEGGHLYSPKNGMMKGTIFESLQGEVKVEFYKTTKDRKALIFGGIGRNTGLEITNPDELIL